MLQAHHALDSPSELSPKALLRYNPWLVMTSRVVADWWSIPCSITKPPALSFVFRAARSFWEDYDQNYLRPQNRAGSKRVDKVRPSE